MGLENGQSTASASGSVTANSGSGDVRSANSDLSFQDKHDFIQGLIWSKREWLTTHGGAKSKWPEHEIHRKQDELKYLEAIADDYRKAAERQRA